MRCKFLLALPLLCAVPLRAEFVRVGRISVERHNVFDSGHPTDQKFPFKQANKLHIVTRETFIRETILFQEGDVYDPQLIDESERLLRSYSVFRYVKIEISPPVNGEVAVFIKTEDVWSTSLELGYGTAGGKQLYRFGFREQNLLGTGSKLGTFVKQDIDRTVRGVNFNDPHFLKSRVELSMGYGTDEKGKAWEINLLKPFYASHVKHAEGASFSVSEDQDRLFEDGDEVARFHHDEKVRRVFIAVNPQPSPVLVSRPRLIYESRANKFSDIEMLRSQPAPRNRTVNAVLFGYDYESLRFLKRRGFQTFDRDEDINTGFSWGIEVGPFRTFLGSTQNGFLSRIRARKISALTPDVYWLNSFLVEGRGESGQVANGQSTWHTRLTWIDWRPGNTAMLRSEVMLGRNLDPETQFLLGGENGLRGYSVRQFSGSKKWLVSMENRKTVAYDFLRLVNLGWAVFADSGMVWKEHERMGSRNMKSDVGVGLRFAPSRSTDPGLVRADLAYALDDNDRRSRWVFNIGADFSFNLKKEKKFEQ